MRLDPSAVVRQLRETGPTDAVYDALLAAGPLVVLAIALAGRGPITELLAGAYLAVLAARTAQNALRA